MLHSATHYWNILIVTSVSNIWFCSRVTVDTSTVVFLSLPHVPTFSSTLTSMSNIFRLSIVMIFNLLVQKLRLPNVSSTKYPKSAGMPSGRVSHCKQVQIRSWKFSGWDDTDSKQEETNKCETRNKITTKNAFSCSQISALGLSDHFRGEQLRCNQTHVPS